MHTGAARCRLGVAPWRGHARGAATALPRPPGSTLSPACPLYLGEGGGQLGALVARALLSALAGVALVDLGAALAGGTEACWGRVGRLAERGVLDGYCRGRDKW